MAWGIHPKGGIDLAIGPGVGSIIDPVLDGCRRWCGSDPQFNRRAHGCASIVWETVWKDQFADRMRDIEQQLCVSIFGSPALQVLDEVNEWINTGSNLERGDNKRRIDALKALVAGSMAFTRPKFGAELTRLMWLE